MLAASTKALVLISAGLLGSATAAAHDVSWILQPELTPTRLANEGALLTASDDVHWPDGRNVALSYWLGAGDIVYRCAALAAAAAAATSTSCWRQQVVDASADDHTRRISTRRRPTPTLGYPSQSLAIQPYVWWQGMRSPSAPGPGPRPTPLPTPRN